MCRVGEPTEINAQGTGSLISFWPTSRAEGEGWDGRGHGLNCDGSCKWHAVPPGVPGRAQLRAPWHLYSTIRHRSTHNSEARSALWPSRAVSLVYNAGGTTYVLQSKFTETIVRAVHMVSDYTACTVLRHAPSMAHSAVMYTIYK
jgi:hypothetical protein